MRTGISGASPSGHLARVRNLTASDRAHLRTLQRNNGDSLSIQRNEFHLKCRAVPIDVHYRSDIARGQLLGRKINREYYTVMFIDCAHLRITFRISSSPMTDSARAVGERYDRKAACDPVFRRCFRNQTRA